MSIFDNPARCPKCDRAGLLVQAPALLIVTTQVGSTGLALADAYGSDFPVSKNETAYCNRASCRWEGPLSEAKSEEQK